MTVTRILPDLQCALVCEDVRQEANGNFILLGITAFLRVPQVPIVANRLCIFTRWCAGVGNFTESVRLIAPDQTTVLREAKVKYALQDPAHNATNLSVFAQLEFTAGGIYFVEVLVDDVMKLRFPLPVIVAPPAPQPEPAAPTASPA
ncbi:MAG: hypothetical protein FJ406_08885 [Verrucomicrobia bacterium]|nr:hypothetical protein [Verrucomicrobiota bacterium]MBM3871709.1 hypothetical protein [Verrucomicrobiota bacterium]